MKWGENDLVVTRPRSDVTTIKKLVAQIDSEVVTRPRSDVTTINALNLVGQGLQL